MPASKHWNSFPALTLRRFAGDTSLCLSAKVFEFSLPDLFKQQKDLRDIIDELLYREGESIDRVVDTIKTREYDTNPRITQPERACLLNLETQVTHLVARLYGQ
jgi:hypothetical protein